MALNLSNYNLHRKSAYRHIAVGEPVDGSAPGYHTVAFGALRALDRTMIGKRPLDKFRGIRNQFSRADYAKCSFPASRFKDCVVVIVPMGS